MLTRIFPLDAGTTNKDVSDIEIAVNVDGEFSEIIARKAHSLLPPVNCCPSHCPTGSKIIQGTDVKIVLEEKDNSNYQLVATWKDSNKGEFVEVFCKEKCPISDLLS